MLGGIGHGLVAELKEAAHLGVELDGLLVGEGVVERQHRYAVLDGAELLRAWSPDA